MYKIIICGSREFNDYQKLKEICDEVISKSVSEHEYNGYFKRERDIEVISGHAQGADLLGEKWAKSYSIMADKHPIGIPVKTFPLLPEHWVDMDVRSDWDVFPKTRGDGSVFNALAGSNRNAQMLKYALENDGDIVFVIAFYKGKSAGSKQMVRIAKKAKGELMGNIEYFIWDDDKKKMRK